MSLTRPKFAQVDTTFAAFNDPITVLHQGSTSANVDVGFVFNRSNGLTGNIAFYWSESLQSIVTASTDSSGVANGNIVPTSYANFTVGTLVANALSFADGTPIATSLNQGLYMGSATATTAVTLIDSVPASGNSMVRWTTTSKDNVNNRLRVGTIDTLSDGTSAYYTEYGVIKSNQSYNVTTFTSNIYANAISLWATGDSNNVSVTFNRIILGSSTTVGYMNAGPAGVPGATGASGTINSTSANIVTTSSNVATGASNSTGALQVGGGAGIAGALYVGDTGNFAGNLNTGHIIPSANVTYDLGSPTNRFRTLYISGSTIDIGGATITAASGQVTFNTSQGATAAGTFSNVTAESGLYTTTGIFWAGNKAALKSGSTYTSSATAPSSPQIGDQWYKTTTDVLYEYISDGTTSYWVDTLSSTTASTANITLVSSGGSSYSNTDVAAYLPTYAGILTAGSLTVGNITANTSGTKITAANVVTTNGVYWANGAAYSSGGGLTMSTVQTANLTAVASTIYPINTTSGNITVALPATPSAGAQVQFVDYAGTFSTNNFTINRNGSNIAGVASNVTVTTNGASVGLLYIDSTKGWVPYAGFSTSPIGTYSVNYLVVAGGGGGGWDVGGGGGAGGYLASTATLTPGTSYTVTIGAGGAAATTNLGAAGNGANSSINSIATAIGGGLGGNWASDNASYKNGGAGGSGGGGGGWTQTSNGGAGTAGQGYAGGSCPSSNSSPGQTGGGGGGAGGVGSTGVTNGAGYVNGGPGVSNSISGTAVTYAAGGRGLNDGTTPVNNGTANTGNGADGAGSGNPGSGGSGIVIISYLGPQRATGGTISSSGGYTIHTFTSSGTFVA